MLAVAEKVDSPTIASYGESMSQLILREKGVFTGLVLKTKQGIGITTNRGTFLLKGAGLEGLIGKNVRVTGVIRDKAIFAVKVDVKT